MIGTPSGSLTVIGGGLAGSEAAWQAAERGLHVDLYEMRPVRMTPAHVTDQLAELVCSNSLGSNLPDRAPGLLKAELRRLRSLVVACADETAVPAGGALAVGREAFAQRVTERIEAHPRITLHRQEVEAFPERGVVVVATGPLTSPALAAHIAAWAGSDQLYFYDAMAPIVAVDSVDLSVAFRASRYGPDGDEGDYLNCPMTQAEYERFVDELLNAQRLPLRDFEREDPRFFEACLPVEVLAARGKQALAFGPLKPVGLTDPRTGRRPHAVVQLRQDHQAATPRQRALTHLATGKRAVIRFVRFCPDPSAQSRNAAASRQVARSSSDGARGRRPSPSGTGMAPSRARVYGCRCAAQICSVGPCSTIRPAYMTRTRSAIRRTTDRSWEMKSIPAPASATNLRMRSATDDWVDASREEIGSSAMSRRGDAASARAMTRRCC